MIDSAMSVPTTNNHARTTRRRCWLFRGCGVLLGLSLFVMVEALLAVFDLGRPSNYDDPFVGFSRVNPLFVSNETGARYEIAKSRLKFFAPDSFPAEKGPHTYRIFCLGGSTVQGRPYSISTSFSTWLKLSLQAADTAHNWDVVNCGGISYASYRLVPILEECLNYQPDLFIICTGHNEFLEERTYGDIKHASPVLSAIQRSAARLRCFVLLRELLLSTTGQALDDSPAEKTEMPAEVDALLDYHNGLKAFHRDEQFRSGVIAHYEHNLRRMIGMAHDAGISVVLVRPPSNLSDSPPFKSQHRDNLAEAELRKWQSLFDKARLRYRDNLMESIRLLLQAANIDDQYAGIHYELGKCYLAVGQFDRARKSFLQARELDICPLRILALMEQALVRVADETGTPLVDAHDLLERECENGILGGLQLVDHIHPKFRGHRTIADALAGEMVRQGWLKPAGDWEARRQPAYQAHFDALDDIYFARGLRELNALRAWSSGRADGPPIETRLKHLGPLKNRTSQGRTDQE